VKIKQTPQLKNVFDFEERVAALEGAFTVEKAKYKVSACFFSMTSFDPERQ
jgi:hypothetical protein